MATRPKNKGVSGFVGRRVRIGQSHSRDAKGAFEAGEVTFARVRDDEVLLTILLDSGTVVEYFAGTKLILFGDDAHCYEITARVTMPLHPGEYPYVGFELAKSPEQAREAYLRGIESNKWKLADGEKPRVLQVDR